MTNEQTKQKMHPYSQVLQWVAEGKEIEANTGCTLSGEVWIPAVTSGILNAANHFGNTEYYQPQDFRLKPERHIHQDLIDARKNGAKIQYSREDTHWIDTDNPQWCNGLQYRIKPEPKPDVTEILSNTMYQGWVKVPAPVCFNENIMVTRCGETGNIKSVEVI